MLKKLILLLIFSTILFFIFIGKDAFAAPLPPMLAVNHQTKECATFFAGDECMDCFPPKGWESLGISWQIECPSDYTHIGEIAFELIKCLPFKNSFCCTIDHSGAAGDCEDVVVNHEKKQCAFVDDINECQLLLTGWERAEEDEFWGRVCPSHEYEWLEDNLKCILKGGVKKTELIEKEDLMNYEFYVIVLSITVATALVILWFLFRRTSRK
jgi:hypothetical protein